MTVACRRVLNALVRGCPCGPWPTLPTVVAPANGKSPSRLCSGPFSFLLLRCYPTRAFSLRRRRHPLSSVSPALPFPRESRTVDGSTQEGRWNGDGDTGVGGLTDSSPQSLFLLHQRRLPILHSYYLARTTTCAAVRSSRVDVWVGVCRSGGRAACRVRVEFARGGERIYPTFLPLLWSFFLFFLPNRVFRWLKQSEETLVVVVDTYTRVFLSIFSISWNFHLCWNKNQISVYLEEIT